MAKVLVLGDIYIETQFYVDQLPIENEFSVAQDVYTYTGSKTLNSARVLAQLGNYIDFFGKAGNDELYLKVISDLKRYKINLDFIKQQQTKTGQLTITTDSLGRDAISVYFGANSTINIDDIIELEEEVTNYQMVYASTNLPLNCMYKLVEICSNKKVSLFLDLSSQQRIIDLNKICNAEFISPNREEAEVLVNEKIKTVEDAFKVLFLLRKFCKGTIILTLDIDGCAIYQKGAKDPIYFKTTPVQSADSTGAGDIFKAVFISEFLKNKNIEQAIQEAQKVAAKSLQFNGINNTLENLNLISY